MRGKIVLLSLVLLLGLVRATEASPVDISHLVLWLDASDVDGDGETSDNPANGVDVILWADKSGHGNDAAGSNVPSYSTRAINGKAGVRFRPNEYLVGQNGFKANITATVFIVGVLRSRAGDSSVVLFSTQPSGGTDSARREPA